VSVNFAGGFAGSVAAAGVLVLLGDRFPTLAGRRGRLDTPGGA
jgi:hypothetical protein